MSNKEEIINKLSKIEGERKILEEELKKVESNDINKCFAIIFSKNFHSLRIFKKYFNSSFIKDNKVDLELLNKPHTYVDENKYCILHEAVKNNKEDIVLFLVNNGADQNLINPEGYTPLMYSAMYNFDIKCKIAIYLTVQPNTFDRTVYGSLFYKASIEGNYLFCFAGQISPKITADLEIKKDTVSALILASVHLNFSMVFYLCNIGANMLLVAPSNVKYNFLSHIMARITPDKFVEAEIFLVALFNRNNKEMLELFFDTKDINGNTVLDSVRYETLPLYVNLIERVNFDSKKEIVEKWVEERLTTQIKRDTPMKIKKN